MFSRVSFVMVAPSHPGNVGSAARAIKNMGFSQLILVAPRFEDTLTHPDAIAMASGAGDILEQACVVDDLSEALANSTLAVALTARQRDLGPPAAELRRSSELVTQHLSLSTAAPVAMVMGTERIGLTNEQIALCQRTCHILTNPDYSSLNVSQAIQLVAYELRYAFMRDIIPDYTATEFATHEAVQAMLTHLEQALKEVGFLDPSHPKKLIPRLHHLFAKAQLSPEEVDILRGICTAMIKTKRANPKLD